MMGDTYPDLAQQRRQSSVDLLSPKYVPVDVQRPVAAFKRAAAVAQAAQAAQAAAEEEAKEESSTVMIKNIACRYTQEDAKDILDSLGLRGKFDWIYMPRSPNMQSNLGYVFVNFRQKEYIEDCQRLCDGKPFGSSGTLKLAEVVPAHIQGDVHTFARLGRSGKNRGRADPLLVNDTMDAEPGPENPSGCREARPYAAGYIFLRTALSSLLELTEGIADTAPEHGPAAVPEGAVLDHGPPPSTSAHGLPPLIDTALGEQALFERASFDSFLGDIPCSPSGESDGGMLRRAPSNGSTCESGGLLAADGSNPARGQGQGGSAASTVMLKNIACQYTVEAIMRILDELGLDGKYDDVYIPRSQARQGNLGYAFVRFTHPDFVEECRQHCHKKPFGQSASHKVCEVVLAHVQGSPSERARSRKTRKQRQSARVDLSPLLRKALSGFGLPQAAGAVASDLPGEPSAELDCRSTSPGRCVLLKFSV